MNTIDKNDGENIWFSYIKRIDYYNYINRGIVDQLSELYSKNFGKYSDTNTKKQIKVSPYKFCTLHYGETAYFCSNQKGDILGFCTIHDITNLGKLNLGIITNLIVDKKYRRRGLATSLLEFALYHNNQEHKEVIDEQYIGMYTVNPISLWILENISGVNYLDLYDCGSDVKEVFHRYFKYPYDDDGRFEFVTSTIIRNCNGIGVYQDEKHLDEYSTDLIDWYSGLMGKLEDPSYEWFLLTKIENLNEFKLDNKKL